MPYWVKLFKAWGIYDLDYHEKYRKSLYNKRYKTYINLVINDIKKRIIAINVNDIDKLIKEKFEDKRKPIWR